MQIDCAGTSNWFVVDRRGNNTDINIWCEFQ
jgi:hypothetical protein